MQRPTALLQRVRQGETDFSSDEWTALVDWADEFLHQKGDPDLISDEELAAEFETAVANVKFWRKLQRRAGFRKAHEHLAGECRSRFRILNKEEG